MKLGIMQPYFFPYLGYFQAIKAVDRYLLYENLSYIKRGWINRNRIAIKNRKEDVYIIVPIKEKSSFKSIKDVKIDYSCNWNHKILKAIHFNYGRTPYFDDFFPFLNEILLNTYDSLHELNSFSINKVAAFLDIKTEIVWDNSKYIPLEESLITRYSGEIISNVDINNRKEDRIIEICKNEKCTQFINAIGGQSLYSKESCAKRGVELSFIKIDDDITYDQISSRFISNLSIIDVLMMMGKEGTNKLLNRYTLI